MGGYVDVDHIGKNDLDTVISVASWIVGMVLSQACKDECEVATESASLRGDDSRDSVGGRCC